MNDQRTTAQNRALHRLFTDISNHCVSVGLDQHTITTNLTAYSVPASPQFIKEVWRSIQITLTGKVSTTELNRKEIDQVYDVFNKFWSELTGEHFPFPNWQEMMYNSQYVEKM